MPFSAPPLEILLKELSALLGQRLSTAAPNAVHPPLEQVPERLGVHRSFLDRR